QSRQLPRQPRAVGSRLRAVREPHRQGADHLLLDRRRRARLAHLELAGIGAVESAVQASAVRFAGRWRVARPSAAARRLSIKALRVNLPPQSSRVAIVTLKNRTPNPILRLFGDAARAVMKSLDLGTTRHARHRASV